MRARVSDIVAIAADMSMMRPETITGRSRLQRVIRVRQACFLIAREHGWSYPEIGHRMNRDHSTVIHGCDTAQVWAERDMDYAAMVDKLRTRAATAKPFAMDRLMGSIGKPVPEPEPEITPAPLDDMDLLSMAVAGHYASAAA